MVSTLSFDINGERRDAHYAFSLFKVANEVTTEFNLQLFCRKCYSYSVIIHTPFSFIARIGAVLPLIVFDLAGTTASLQ